MRMPPWCSSTRQHHQHRRYMDSLLDSCSKRYQGGLKYIKYSLLLLLLPRSTQKVRG